MADGLAEKAAAALDEKLEALGLVIVPRKATDGMMEVWWRKYQGNLRLEECYVHAMTASPDPDTKALAQAVLDVVLELGE